MRNKQHPERLEERCRYYGVLCKDIAHCTIDYERCSSQPSVPEMPKDEEREEA